MNSRRLLDRLSNIEHLEVFHDKVTRPYPFQDSFSRAEEVLNLRQERN